MKFYFRTDELKELETLRKQSAKTSRMAVLVGRRRVGKTSLALEFIDNKPHVYLFVARKSEALLCQSFADEIQRQLKITIHGRIETFKQIFELLIEHARTHKFVVIVDEFQEFLKINPSVYSDLQGIWDKNKNTTQMMLIFIGSIYSLMHNIFENEKEPLFGRADRIIKIKPFTIAQVQSLLADHSINDLKRLFEFYVITGCVPKYLDILLTNECSTLSESLHFMLQANSPFLDEGKNQLIEEFGRDHSIYFSILELIARGKTSTSEIESVIHTSISAYLHKLETDYHIIKSYKPIDAKPNAKLQKYTIIDNFLKFWFRYFYRYRDSIEIGNYQYLIELIKQDFSTYSGRLLENFFVELLAATKQYNRIGSYWERDHKNEIDIIAINDSKKIMLIAEVKTNSRRNSINRLEQRATNLLRDYHDYQVDYKLLSLEQAKEFLD